MQVSSREITYREIIEQVFFDDDSELIIKTGWPEGQEFDPDISVEWATTIPAWAKDLTAEQLSELADKEPNEVSTMSLLDGLLPKSDFTVGDLLKALSPNNGTSGKG